MSIKRLGELIRKFEDVYLGTGAGAKLNLRNFETDDASNVELHFRPPGLDAVRPGLWITVGDGRPTPLVDAPPAIQARAAKHLPKLAKLLDGVAAIIETEVDAGTAALDSWFVGRGVDV